MEKRAFGKTGINVSVLGFGGAEIGFQGAGLAEVEQLLGSALDAGLNVIDTAECYANSEQLIGEAVSGRRNEYFLFSKCGHSRGYGDPDWNDIGRLQSSLDQSLSRLKTDHLDLFQLHSCSEEVLKQGDVIEFMKRAKASGKARFIGYSGENEGALCAIRTDIFDALQTSVNIADQGGILTILPEAQRRQMGIIAKRPIANAAWQHQQRPDDYYADYWERFKALEYDFLQRSEADSAAFALRFTLMVPGISVAIVGTKKPGRWEQNAQVARQGPLSREEFESVRKRWNERAKSDWVGQV